MDIDQKYQEIISQLEQGHRALVKFSSLELEALEKILSETRDLTTLEKTLCLVEHSAKADPRFEVPLIQLLNSDLPDHLIVFALNCARKHIITARFSKGNRLEFNFLETLKKLLHSPSFEVKEWTLRTIEECGNQGVYFLREFDKIKPAPWKWFNAHARATRELITFLERRWRPHEKS